jgi:hypothetical protein
MGAVKVNATLSPPNPKENVQVTDGATTQVQFSFVTDGTIITLGGVGALAIGIVVNEIDASDALAALDAGLPDAADLDASSDAAITDAGADVPEVIDNPCVPLAANATDVYVDKRFVGGMSTGVAGCPFTTILAGISAAQTLSGRPVVHVAGDSPPLNYSEVGAVLMSHEILLGDGPAKTTISASGACGTGTCAVMVNGAGVLDGFTVVSPLGDGIVTALSNPPPSVRNVAATGSKGSGIVAMGAVDLGPNIVASKNGAQGVASTGTGLVHVISGGSASNAFDSNGANGINIEGATLRFDGGNARANTLNGIRFGAVGSAATTHMIFGLVAVGNKDSGISSVDGQNLTIRSSWLTENTNYGLNYTYGVASSILNLGTGADLGNNTFGGFIARNARAGIYLCRSRGTGTQPAEGDSFASCPPTQTVLTGCTSAPGSYTDVAYAPNVPGNPVTSVGCMVGP